ncbi:MAG: type II secretion system F family protein, partial [Pseudohongiella sp.]
MASFTYQALDAEGKRVNGVMEGDGERQVRARLRAQKLKPLAVTSGKAPAATAGLASLFKRQQRLTIAELSLVSRQLASLIQSGLPLDEALQISVRQSRSIRVKTLLSQVRSRVLEGHTLAQAMGEHPAAFDRMYCAMVRAGESAGFLGEVMERLAEYTESGQQSRQKLQMALIYPFALLGVSVLVVTLLMTFVVPRLVSMFASSNRELPGLTRGLIAVSDFMSSGWALLLLALSVVAVAGFRWRLRQAG